MSAAALALDAISDPAAALVAARKMAQRPDLTPDEAAILCGILQPWWETETNASVMAEHIGNLGGAALPGNPAHRRLVRVLLLCSAVVRHRSIVTELRLADMFVREADAWTLGQKSMEPRVICEMITTYCDSVATYAGYYQGYAQIDKLVAMAVKWSALVTACNGHVANFSVTQVAITMAEDDDSAGSGSRALAELADLIRAAVPVCPLAEVLP